jgi:hypothetical protein
MERADIFFSKLCETVERKTEGRNVLVIYFLEEREGERDKVREFYFYFFFSIWFAFISLVLLGHSLLTGQVCHVLPGESCDKKKIEYLVLGWAHKLKRRPKCFSQDCSFKLHAEEGTIF